MSENINKSAYNFFLCIEFILRKRLFTLDEISSYIENTYDIFVYKEAILKYIRTLRLVGFKFERLNNKTYKLKNIPFKIDADAADAEVFSECLHFMKNFHATDIAYNINDLAEKIFLFLPDDLNNNIKSLDTSNSQNNILKTIKKYCLDGQRLEVTYLKGGNKICDLIEPLDIFTDKFVVYLLGFNLTKKMNGLINCAQIIDVVQTPIKNKFIFKKQSVTIRFFAKFANAYTLKEGEEILKRERDSLYVKSFYHDKYLLFKNILRYMEHCEIVAPEALRNDFRIYVEKLYKNYACIE